MNYFLCVDLTKKGFQATIILWTACDMLVGMKYKNGEKEVLIYSAATSK